MQRVIYAFQWFFVLLVYNAYSKTLYDEKVVVIAESADVPSGNTLTIDRETSLQPPSTADGAGYLQSLPGFNIARKGSNGGDPGFRGQSGSRLQIQQDGKQLTGTCGGRMDPPTGYISSADFDQITLIKGPQSVRYGPTGSAGTILFNRKHAPLSAPTENASLSLSAGSFERLDTAIGGMKGDTAGYFRFDSSHSQSDDFKDGNGTELPSAYSRSALQAALGFSAGTSHLWELSGSTRTGHAQFADRINNARKIAADDLGFFYRHRPAPAISGYQGLECQCYFSQNNHIMDNFDTTLPVPPCGSNPMRKNAGTRIRLDSDLSNSLSLTAGLDSFYTTQKTRKGDSPQSLLAASAKTVFSAYNLGGFTELAWDYLPVTAFLGLRWDFYRTELADAFATSPLDDCSSDSLPSGFFRLEYDNETQSGYIGFGHASRIPDYWEILKSGRQFYLNPEITDQMDLGWTYRRMSSPEMDISVSGFYGKIRNYILIDQAASPMARNIDAQLLGGELALSAPLSDAWQLISTLAYTRGQNQTNNHPLGQISPLEIRFAATFTHERWQTETHMRLVSRQERIAIGEGNIVGQDHGPSEAFAVFSCNAAYRVSDHLILWAGIDNLFNATYAEHISKNSLYTESLQPPETLAQVNEPGRTLRFALALRL